MSRPQLETGPLWRAFLVFLLPLMAQNILQSLSMTINSIMVGRILGVEALASASVFFPVAFFFVAFLIGLSAGASVLIGQAFGAGKSDLVKRITGTTLSVAAIGGVVIALLGWMFVDDIMAMLGTPEAILPGATHYAKISFLTMPVMFLFLTGSSLLRGVRDTVRPLMAQGLATVLAAGLTPLLIHTTDLGAASAAVAMGLAQGIAFVGLGFYLRATDHPMAPDTALLRNLLPDGGLLKTVLRIGLPTGVQVVVGSLSGLVIIGLVNSFGFQATAAYGAVGQIQSYVQFPALSDCHCRLDLWRADDRRRSRRPPERGVADRADDEPHADGRACRAGLSVLASGDRAVPDRRAGGRDGPAFAAYRHMVLADVRGRDDLFGHHAGVGNGAGANADRGFLYPWGRASGRHPAVENPWSAGHLVGLCRQLCRADAVASRLLPAGLA